MLSIAIDQSVLNDPAKVPLSPGLSENFENLKKTNFVYKCCHLIKLCFCCLLVFFLLVFVLSTIVWAVLYGLSLRASLGSQIAANDTIGRLRWRQLQLIRANPDLYDAKDIDFITENDNLIRLVAMSKTNPNEAAELLDKIMRWRKEQAVSRVSVSEIPCEIFEVGGAAEVGYDKDGDPVYWVKIRCEYFNY